MCANRVFQSYDLVTEHWSRFNGRSGVLPYANSRWHCRSRSHWSTISSCSSRCSALRWRLCSAWSSLASASSCTWRGAAGCTPQSRRERSAHEHERSVARRAVRGRRHREYDRRGRRLRLPLEQGSSASCHMKWRPTSAAERTTARGRARHDTKMDPRSAPPLDLSAPCDTRHDVNDLLASPSTLSHCCGRRRKRRTFCKPRGARCLSLWDARPLSFLYLSGKARGDFIGPQINT